MHYVDNTIFDDIPKDVPFEFKIAIFHSEKYENTSLEVFNLYSDENWGKICIYRSRTQKYINTNTEVLM